MSVTRRPRDLTSHLALTAPSRCGIARTDDIPPHVQQVGKSWRQRRRWIMRTKRIVGRGALNTFLSKKVLDKWSKELNLSIRYVEAPDHTQSVCSYRLAQSPSA